MAGSLAQGQSWQLLTPPKWDLPISISVAHDDRACVYLASEHDGAFRASATGDPAWMSTSLGQFQVHIPRFFASPAAGSSGANRQLFMMETHGDAHYSGSDGASGSWVRKGNPNMTGDACGCVGDPWLALAVHPADLTPNNLVGGGKGALRYSVVLQILRRLDIGLTAAYDAKDRRKGTRTWQERPTKAGDPFPRSRLQRSVPQPPSAGHDLDD